MPEWACFPAMPTDRTGGEYADVNGLRLYFEAHGEGLPLALLHGGFGTIEMFDAIVPILAGTRKVIVPELQGHGRTADIDRPLRPEFMADDIAGLAAYLGCRQLDILGFSLGGLVALQTVIRHPGLVRRAVVVSAPARSSAIYSQRTQNVPPVSEYADALKATPFYARYNAVAPKPQDWPVLVEKMLVAVTTAFDYSDAIRQMKTPFLLVSADADIFPPSHAAEMFEMLGGGLGDPGTGISRPPSRLAVLPGQSHYTLMGAPALVAATVEFLDATGD
jgi:pimeloyl-ACP methyl ester carboxylesterase